MNHNTTAISVENLDLERYLGLWYEIGRLPLSSEDETASDVTAEYSLQDDGSIAVDNRCINADGLPSRALGHAETDSDHPARLSVSFLPSALNWLPFTRSDYWILKIDPEYHTALVGTPNLKHLWLLSRSPQLDAEIEAEYLAVALEQGFRLEEWIRPKQSGEPVSDVELEQQ